MKAEGIGLEDAAMRRGGNELVGTATQVADHLQSPFEAGVFDGFVIAPTTFPSMFEQFCRSVVPELQRCGLFRTEYTGRTPRENLQH